MKYLLTLILFIATNLQVEQATSKVENQESNANALEETVEYIARTVKYFFLLAGTLRLIYLIKTLPDRVHIEVVSSIFSHI